MTAIVLDASLAVALVLGELDEAETVIWRDRLSADASLVPAHWTAEVGNALRNAVRRNRLKPGNALALANAFQAIPVKLEPAVAVDTIPVLLNLAIAENLSFYDAAYVDLARRRRTSLATLDEAMRLAAGRLGIDVLPAS